MQHLRCMHAFLVQRRRGCSISTSSTCINRASHPTHRDSAMVRSMRAAPGSLARRATYASQCRARSSPTLYISAPRFFSAGSSAGSAAVGHTFGRQKWGNLVRDIKKEVSLTILEPRRRLRGAVALLLESHVVCGCVEEWIRVEAAFCGVCRGGQGGTQKRVVVDLFLTKARRHTQSAHLRGRLPAFLSRGSSRS